MNRGVLATIVRKIFCTKFDKIWVGLHFGRFWKTLGYFFTLTYIWSPGLPDWANFRLLENIRGCFLWDVFLKITEVAKILWLLSIMLKVLYLF
jgi:hypothetical protein